jgi:cobalt-zinc-cadmium efflux system outer membrane protein
VSSLPRGRSVLGAIALAASCAVGAQAVFERVAHALPPAAPDATGALRLGDVIREARSRRREIVAATARASAAGAVPDRVSALPDPMVMASLDHLPLMLDGANYSFMVEQQFPLSGNLGARARAASAEAAALRKDIRRVALDVETEAAVAFAMVAEAQAMKAVTTEQLGLARTVVDLTKARLAGADASAADVVRAEVDVQRLVADVDALDAEIDGAGAMLRSATGRSPGSEVPLCDPASPEGAPLPAPRLAELALATRPELGVMRARTAAARADVDVMESMYSPMAVARLGGAYTMTDGPGLMTAFGVSIPLWRGSLASGVTEAEQMVRMASAEVDAMAQMIRGEVGAARGRVVGLQSRKVALDGKLLPLARTSLDLSLTSYASGQLPLVSVVDSARALRELRMELVSVRVQLLIAWVRLGRATGTLDIQSLSSRRIL